MMTNPKETDGTTFGNSWLFKSLISLLGWVNIKIIYFIAAVFVVPITLVVSKGARITYHYYRYRRHFSKLKSLWATYCNNRIFSQTVIDKFAMYAGHKFKIAYHGIDKFNELTSSQEPLLMLNAHIGCSEIVGYSYKVEKPCNVLVYGGEKQSLMDYRKALFERMNMHMIPVGFGESHSQDIIEALDRGETINVFADRFMTENKVVTSTIHGNKVNLARGPFSLATTRGLSVIMVSAMKERNGSYTAYLTPLEYDKTLTSRQQRQSLADAYTAEIERLLEMYPYQWFNFSDLWAENISTNK